MTRILRTVLGIGVLLLPASAHAQRIPLEIAVTFLSPLLFIVLAGVLGLFCRSWHVAGVHAGLIVVWVLLAGLLMYFVENDYVIWAPIVVYAVHAAVIVVLIFVAIGKHLVGGRRSDRP